MFCEMFSVGLQFVSDAIAERVGADVLG